MQSVMQKVKSMRRNTRKWKVEGLHNRPLAVRIAFCYLRIFLMKGVPAVDRNSDHANFDVWGWGRRKKSVRKLKMAHYQQLWYRSTPHGWEGLHMTTAFIIARSIIIFIGSNINHTLTHLLYPLLALLIR